MAFMALQINKWLLYTFKFKFCDISNRRRFSKDFCLFGFYQMAPPLFYTIIFFMFVRSFSISTNILFVQFQFCIQKRCDKNKNKSFTQRICLSRFFRSSRLDMAYLNAKMAIRPNSLCFLAYCDDTVGTRLEVAWELNI